MSKCELQVLEKTPTTVPDLINYLVGLEGDRPTKLMAANSVLSKMVMRKDVTTSDQLAGKRIRLEILTIRKLAELDHIDVIKYQELMQELARSRELSEILEHHLQLRLNSTIIIDGLLLNGSMELKPI